MVETHLAAPVFGPTRSQVLNILLVEDDALHATTLQEQIEREGSRVVGPIGTLREVMKIIDQRELDGAVLDINLGGEMVFPAADLLRNRGIPFLFATSYRRQALPARFRSVLHMMKPLEEHGLRRGLRAMLGAGLPISPGISSIDDRSAPLPLQGKRIFMIEDNDALYIETRKNLQRAGASVWGCPAHFPDIPHLVPASAFDAALVDIDDQEKDIIEVVAELRRREIPVLLTCSWDASRVVGLMRNAQRFLLKPIGHAELVQALADVARR